jgi:type IX secretion system PorP/SprF family membrane protein
MNGNSPLFGDFGFGLLYYAIFSERNNVYLGASANHLNTPVISLSEFGDIRLKRLYTIHAGGEILLNRELSFMPNYVAYIQNPSRMVMPGFHMRYKHRDWKEVALRAGVWTRMVRGEPQAIINDAIIVSATFEYEAWLFGVSYDISTSRLINATSGRGAFEFSLQYINRDTKYRKPINCPKF